MSRRPWSHSVRILSVLLLVGCLGITRSSAQEVAKRFTNQDVIDMTGLGLSDELIIAKIRSESSAIRASSSRIAFIAA